VRADAAAAGGGVRRGAGIQESPEAAAPDRAAVLARIRRQWIVHNVVNAWASVMAAGPLWGANWTAGSFGVDLFGAVAGSGDWRALGIGRSVVLGSAASHLRPAGPVAGVRESSQRRRRFPSRVMISGSRRALFSSDMPQQAATRVTASSASMPH
jgi:hypothetical protein